MFAPQTLALSNLPPISVFTGLGVIHRGNVGKSRSIMAPYLPSAPGGSTPSPYSGACVCLCVCACVCVRVCENCMQQPAAFACSTCLCLSVGGCPLAAPACQRWQSTADTPTGCPTPVPCLASALGPAPASASMPAEGGALYALGLIHTNHGHDVRQFLLDSQRGTQNEVLSRRQLRGPAAQVPSCPPLACSSDSSLGFI